MKYQLKTDPETGLRILDISGNVVPGDIIQMLQKLWSADEYVSLDYVVWDFTNSETNYYFEDIFKLFEFVKETKQLRGPHTLAVVAPHDNEFGMSRMYAMLSECEVPKINVFRELSPAILWLESCLTPEEWRNLARLNNLLLQSG